MSAAGLPLAAALIRVPGDPAGPPILDIDRLALAAGERVALTGPSGSGKTTLLHCLAGIARPHAGSILWGRTDVAALRGPASDAWRRRHVGLVFQDFHLVPELDVLANILLPAQFGAWRVAPALRDRAAALAERLGLRDPRRRAGLLSRGEQQRTAIARALLADPPLLVADEPTASLDRRNADALADLLLADAAGRGATLVVATHDPAFIARLGRVWHLRDGRLAAGAPGA